MRYGRPRKVNGEGGLRRCGVAAGRRGAAVGQRGPSAPPGRGRGVGIANRPQPLATNFPVKVKRTRSARLQNPLPQAYHSGKAQHNATHDLASSLFATAIPSRSS